MRDQMVERSSSELMRDQVVERSSSFVSVDIIFEVDIFRHDHRSMNLF